jgi:hypothetical protein
MTRQGGFFYVLFVLFNILFASVRLKRTNKKTRRSGFFVLQWKQEAAGAARFPYRLLHCLDGGGEAALVASSLVLVNDLLVGDDVERLC